jgi:hypothetical protein
MPWVRFDDRFPTHRKVRRLSDAAFRLHVSAIHWCAEHLTDGHVPADELDLVSDVTDPKSAVAELEPKLWEPLDDGWLIHDYLEYQPPASKVRADRDAKKERQDRWRDKKSRDASQGESQDESRDASQDDTPYPSRTRTRPEGSRAALEPPSPRCPQHVDNPSPPPCGRCKEARIARERWDTDEAQRAKEAMLATRKCGLCDTDGYRLTPGTRIPLSPYEKCDHRPLRSVS